MPPAPRFSVLTAVFNPSRAHLRACLRSVRDQTFPAWEHVVVDDGSTAPWVVPLLADAARRDHRVRVIRRSVNGGIVAARRDALAVATGELVALVDHHDVLEPDALAAMDAAVDPDVDVAYSDNDFIAPDGVYVDPMFKPDFSPERLRAQNYVAHFVVARRAVVEAAGGFRNGFDGAENHDLLLRLSEQTERFAHVPRILYHWRQWPAGVSAGTDEPRAFDAGVRAVADHCARTGIDATVEHTVNEGCYRVVRRVAERPLVSVVIPTRGSRGRVWGLERCFVVEAVRTVVERSTYRHLEFVVVYDTATAPDVLDAVAGVAGDRLRLVPFADPFNFSAKINVGAAAAAGDLLLLLNDDTELLEPASIEVLVGHVQTAGVAMAGAKLLFGDGTLQHGGHVYGDQPEHACVGWRGDSPGPWPLRPLAVERECSGVTAGCALVRSDAFEAVGGFTVELPLNYNDVDFSLKLRAAGHRIIWTPWAVWYHFESRTRPRGIFAYELAWINHRWGGTLGHDPYLNPNLSPWRNDYLELPPPPGPLRREPV